jgi:hypothetical protein
MRSVQTAVSVLVVDPFVWGLDWAWGVPLIVLTVVIHIAGLGVMSKRAVRLSRTTVGRRPMTALVMVAGATTLLATVLHGLEAAIWASAYLFLGTFPDFKVSMLYSLNAITSYGHTDLSLNQPWQLMGALEALNGWLLFGLTTAFMFAAIHVVWSSGNVGENERHSGTDVTRLPEDPAAKVASSRSRPDS